MVKKRAIALILSSSLLLSIIVAAVYFEITAPNIQLQSTVSRLREQLANVTNTIDGLTSTNIETSLNVHEMIGANSSYMGGLVATPVPFNYLWIQGYVANAGTGYALNVGLHVDAYKADGMQVVNLTVPLTSDVLGSDNETEAYVVKTYGNYSLDLDILDGGQRTNVGLNIFHQNSAKNWTITPVYWTYTLQDVDRALANQPLKYQESYLEKQIEDLNRLATNLTTTTLQANLKIEAKPDYLMFGIHFNSSMLITGSVTNVGNAKAYNAGLHIVAYSYGTLEANMTIPLSYFGKYNSLTYNSPARLSTLNSGYGYDKFSSSNSQEIWVTIDTPALISNWTVTPVWTNYP